jgi:hypothetical protein
VTSKPWWRWTPSTYWQVGALVTFYAVFGAVVFRAMTGDWGRAWSYGIGWAGAIGLFECNRVRRRVAEVRRDNLPPFGDPPIQ